MELWTRSAPAGVTSDEATRTQVSEDGGRWAVSRGRAWPPLPDGAGRRPQAGEEAGRLKGPNAAWPSGGRERRDVTARAARDRLARLLDLHPRDLGLLTRERAEAMACSVENGGSVPAGKPAPGPGPEAAAPPRP